MRFVLTICLFLALAPPIVWAAPLSLRAAAVRAAAPAKVTTYAQMTAQLKAEAAGSPLVRVVSVGKSAGGTRNLWLVRLADPSTGIAKTMRLLVLCRQHGDEPAPTEAMLRLIHAVASGGDPALRSELSHVTLYLVPMVNPDGAGAGTRDNARGADLNRDWGVFHQPETRAVAQAAGLIHPALIVDAHNWDNSDEYNADCIEVPRPMETAQGRASHAMQRQAVRDLAADGYAVHPTAWGDDSDPHLAHRWFSRQDITSLLVETHSGSPADRADFERREGMYTALIHCLARNADAPWTRQASPATDEAALFPAPDPPGPVHPAHSFADRLPCGLWAFAVYGLALWGMGRRQAPPYPHAPLRRGRRGSQFFALGNAVLRGEDKRPSVFCQAEGRFTRTRQEPSLHASAFRPIGRYAHCYRKAGTSAALCERVAMRGTAWYNSGRTSAKPAADCLIEDARNLAGPHGVILGAVSPEAAGVRFPGRTPKSNLTAKIREEAKHYGKSKV